MGRKKIDRTGEEGYNSFGSKMIISKYRDALDIDVYFPEYNWTAKNNTYNNFKKGGVNCPYEPRQCGVGYLGEGKYKTRENGKSHKYYDTWHHMLQRCYDPKFQEKNPSYKGCSVEDYLFNFQNAAEFYNSIYYEVPGEIMHLDKDILYKGNKVYSRETCIFVPQRINDLFVRCNNTKGNIQLRESGNYRVRCCNGYGKTINLGTYKTKEEAFKVYKQYKEKVIKEVIDSYEGIIPEPHYSRLKEAMYNYEVEMDD